MRKTYNSFVHFFYMCVCPLFSYAFSFALVIMIYKERQADQRKIENQGKLNVIEPEDIYFKYPKQNDSKDGDNRVFLPEFHNLAFILRPHSF